MRQRARMTSTQNVTLTSLPAFTTPEVRGALGAIVVACALVGLPILFVTINYLRNAAHSHGQAINRCDATCCTFLYRICLELCEFRFLKSQNSDS